MHTISIVLALALVPALFSPAVPCELPVCTAPRHQGYPLIVSDGSGGALVAWLDFRNGVDYDIYVQRVQRSPAGLIVAPGWPTDGVAVTRALEDQNLRALVSDDMGGVIAVWTDVRDYFSTRHDIYAQRVTAQGTIAPGWPPDGLPLCTAPGSQGGPRALADGAGGAIVVWEDYRAGGSPGESGSNPDVYAIRLRPDGSLAPGWAVNGNPVCTAPEGQFIPVLVADGAGGAIVAWGDMRNLATTHADPYATRITPDGAIAQGWPAQGVQLSAAPGPQGGEARVCTDGAGGAIVAWVDYRNDPIDLLYPDIFAQRVGADGALTPGWPADGLAVCEVPDIQWNLDMVSDGAGGAFLAWDDYRNYASSAADLFGQRITGSGAVAPGWVANGLRLVTGAGWQLNPKLVPDGQGGILVGFVHTFGADYDLFAQRVAGDGTIPPGWPAVGRALCAGPAVDQTPAAASDGAGGMIVASNHVTAVDNDIYANWVPGEGPVPTLVALASAKVDLERVVLVWYGAEASGLAGSVERRSEPTDWETIGTVIADGTGAFRYEDRAVTPATRYGYRLRYRTAAEELVTDEHWVEVPAAAFSLQGLQPNPAVGDLVVTFSLPSAEPARLELYDLAGRLILGREVGALGPGTHSVNLSDGRPLLPGIYSVLLAQGQQRGARRVVILR